MQCQEKLSSKILLPRMKGWISNLKSNKSHCNSPFSAVRGGILLHTHNPLAVLRAQSYDLHLGAGASGHGGQHTLDLAPDAEDGAGQHMVLPRPQPDLTGQPHARTLTVPLPVKHHTQVYNITAVCSLLFYWLLQFQLKWKKTALV